MHSLSRRDFLATAAAAATTGAAAVGEPERLLARQADAADGPVAFFLIGDTHFLAGKDDTSKLDPRSATVNSNLVDRLNELAGKPIPAASGGGKVLAPRGVIHAGDCIDTGDKPNLKMQATEWSAFTDTLGLTGKDGKLSLPVYEVHGNHDSPRGDGLAIKKIIERNKSRPGVTNVSASGVHYSWDWGPVHFINLGIVVGQAADVSRNRRYAPLGSLDFLISDLKEKVGSSGRPVVITHHVDMIRYSQPLPVEDKKAAGMEWDPADVSAFYQALRGYNIAAILYGHTHARNIFRWDGSAKGAKEGIPVFNVDNGAHFSGKLQAFFYIEVAKAGLTVREYATTDAWETGSWTPQFWTTTARDRS